MYLNIGASEDQTSSHVFIEPDSHLKRTNSSRSKNSSIRFSQHSSSNHLLLPSSRNIYQPRLERNAHSFRFSSFYEAKFDQKPRNIQSVTLKTFNKSTQTSAYDTKEPIESSVAEEDGDHDKVRPNNFPKISQQNRKSKESVFEEKISLDGDSPKSFKSKFISIIINYFVLFTFIIISACIFNHLEKQHVKIMFEVENSDLIRTVAIIVNNTKCPNNIRLVESINPTQRNCLSHYNISGLFDDFPGINNIWNDSITFNENLAIITQLKYQQSYDRINLSKSILFVSSVITTVGYGLFSPRSQSGRLFCIILTMFGVPLSITTSSNLAQFLMIYLRELNISCVVAISNFFHRLHTYQKALKKAYKRDTSLISCYDASSPSSIPSRPNRDQPCEGDDDTTSQTVSNTSDVFLSDEPMKREFDILLSRDLLLKNGLVLTNREKRLLASIKSFDDNDLLLCERCVSFSRKRLSEVYSRRGGQNQISSIRTKDSTESGQCYSFPLAKQMSYQMTFRPESGDVNIGPSETRIIENQLANVEEGSSSMRMSPEKEVGEKSTRLEGSRCCANFKWIYLDRVIFARILSFVLLILVVFFLDIIAPALIFQRIEADWSFLDSVYVATISMSTVGLGDLVPDLQTMTDGFSYVYEICLAAYLIFGTVLFMVILRSFHETFLHIQTQIHQKRIFQRLESNR